MEGERSDGEASGEPELSLNGQKATAKADIHASATPAFSDADINELSRHDIAPRTPASMAAVYAHVTEIF
ncbi:hypothetical protein EVAR_99681_1 [Eumeta japonica]|uniref:Uncharacterized protein n=1 Tax=Eumeta variegata TaxID=151549 RepID=A0A4C1YFD3_EUMVA|nr:hypothetical protein EVAR_99681_1 [Eumeta japonica]